MEGLASLCLTATRAWKVNSDSNLEVRIHKVSGLFDDHKMETQRDSQQRANNDLADAELEKKKISLAFTWQECMIIQYWKLLANDSNIDYPSSNPGEFAEILYVKFWNWNGISVCGQ